MEGNFKGQRVVMQILRIAGNEKEIVYLVLPRHSRGGGNPGLYGLSECCRVSPPNDELVAWRVPKGATIVVEAKVPKTIVAVA
jgi:hypothetical protein